MDSNNFEIIKQSLGNVVYSQKTQEMAVIRKRGYSTGIKWGNIIIIGLVFLSLFLQIFNPDEKKYLYVGIFLTVLESLFLIFQLSFSPEKEMLEHQNTASQLWLMREKHLNLLTDIKNEIFDKKAISKKRDALTNELSQVYSNALKTNNNDYTKASIALNGNEKPKADDDEMNTFLPKNLQDKKED
ncbi:SLATT domain-containing protein [Poseidonibacter ostreae]|uniref:SLATT domain-containing protein n=1 Tax=Poseidonibacter ostreae TaxID=2654171 RepID=A0A6L4WU32_9BACT|nr:SLATT domain-containing protein [Poseidonibacter ostreae]KAB7887610.1 SLATT domain-containing protein [Poseidonibacter ostreae]KAB7889628.1 SLATT domain-containing protein [Poseidonibacter ostreae]